MRDEKAEKSDGAGVGDDDGREEPAAEKKVAADGSDCDSAGAGGFFVEGELVEGGGAAGQEKNSRDGPKGECQRSRPRRILKRSKEPAVH